MKNTIIELNDNNFDLIISKEKKIILVDFWADWCNPCKIMIPILEKIYNKYNKKIIITKLNVDNNNNTTLKYNIRGVPTLLLFKNNNLIDKNIGLMTLNQLENFININLLK